MRIVIGNFIVGTCSIGLEGDCFDCGVFDSILVGCGSTCVGLVEEGAVDGHVGGFIVVIGIIGIIGIIVVVVVGIVGRRA